MAESARQELQLRVSKSTRQELQAEKELEELELEERRGRLLHVSHPPSFASSVGGTATSWPPHEGDNGVYL